MKYKKIPEMYNKYKSWKPLCLIYIKFGEEHPFPAGKYPRIEGDRLLIVQNKISYAVKKREEGDDGGENEKSQGKFAEMNCHDN